MPCDDTSNPTLFPTAIMYSGWRGAERGAGWGVGGVGGRDSAMLLGAGDVGSRRVAAADARAGNEVGATHGAAGGKGGGGAGAGAREFRALVVSHGGLPCIFCLLCATYTQPYHESSTTPHHARSRARTHTHTGWIKEMLNAHVPNAQAGETPAGDEIAWTPPSPRVLAAILRPERERKRLTCGCPRRAWAILPLRHSLSPFYAYFPPTLEDGFRLECVGAGGERGCVKGLIEIQQ